MAQALEIDDLKEETEEGRKWWGTDCCSQLEAIGKREAGKIQKQPERSEGFKREGKSARPGFQRGVRV